MAISNCFKCISQTISSVMLCMAWWTQKLMVYFAICQKRVELPQVHSLCRGDPSATVCLLGAGRVE